MQAKRNHQLVLGYGAAAKGNTLLNYAGVKTDLLPAVADRALSKQGKMLPGSHIPVLSPEDLKVQNPDAFLVLPWKLIDEVSEQLSKYELFTAILGYKSPRMDDYQLITIHPTAMVSPLADLEQSLRNTRIVIGAECSMTVS